MLNVGFDAECIPLQVQEALDRAMQGRTVSKMSTRVRVCRRRTRGSVSKRDDVKRPRWENTGAGARDAKHKVVHQTAWCLFSSVRAVCAVVWVKPATRVY